MCIKQLKQPNVYVGISTRGAKTGIFMNLIPKDIENYCVEHSSRPSPLAHELMKTTQESIHGSQMLIGELEASVLSLLIKLGKVKTILELGTYTGFSALIMAEALPEDGKVTTIDINPQTTALAKEFWNRSAHGHKINHILRPGSEALAQIEEKFDLIFIDADKNGYPSYLDWATKHLNPNGTIVTDNVLWSGKVVGPHTDKQTNSIREHNQIAKLLAGFQKTLLPIRDGMYILKKLSESD